jgi:hypothetical protein
MGRPFAAILTFFLCLGFFITADLTADQRSTVELELYDMAAKGPGDTWIGVGAGKASYSLEQTGNRNVRSQFEFSAQFIPTAAGLPEASFAVERAFAKFRFSDMRGTAGKAPYSWGEGLIFNVADIIFSRGTGTNLMQSEFEDRTTWLTGLSWYLGPFSFLEVLLIPAALGVLTDESTGEITGYSLPAVEDGRAGLRWVTKLWDIKAEAGYLFDGSDGVEADDEEAAQAILSGESTAFQRGAYYHRPYLGLQGNLGIDWHLSASLELPDRGKIAANIEEGLLISSGIYSLIPVGYDDSIGFRIESLIHPAGTWEEEHGAGATDYGLYGYGEVGYDFGSGVSLALRSLVNPIDLSTRVSPGLSWNIFQGFTLLGYATLQTGESGDTYPWDPSDGSSSAEGSSGGTAGAVGGLSPAGGGGTGLLGPSGLGSSSSSGLALMLGCRVVY